MAAPFPDFGSDASTDTGINSVATLLEQNAELKRQLQQCRRELQQAREAQRVQENDRQRVEAALAESETRFQLIANNINQFFFLHSADECKYLYASPAYETIWGRSCESLYQNPNSWLEGVHPEDRSKVLQSLVEQHNGLPVKRDYRVVQPNGSIRWVVTYLDPIYEAGELVRWAGLTDDITDRKIAEATLLENQRFVEQIADSSTAILYIYDLLEQRNVYVNRQMQTILGYSPEAIQSMGNQLLPKLVHPDDLPKIVGRVEQYFTAGEHEVIDVEYRMRHANGEWRWLHSRDRVFNRTADGAPRQILGTAVDITVHKQSEAELQRQSRRSRLFSDIALTIRQSLDLPSILKTTVVEVHRFLQADRVLFLQLHADDSGTVVEESVSPGYPALVGQHLWDRWFVEEFVESCRQGRICLIQNTATATLHPCHAEFLRQFGVQANLVVPILLSGASQSASPGNSQKSHLGGTETPPPPVLWGLLIAHQCAYPRQWNDFETDMMGQLANQVGVAIVQSQLMEALQQSEEQRRLALDLTHIGSWDWQITGNKLIWNDNHYWLLGLEPGEGEVNIQTWYDRIHPDDLDWVRQRFYQSLTERTNYEAEYRVLHPNGRLRWILSRGRGIYDEAGQAIRMVGVMIDISDRKRVEQSLRQQAEREQALNRIVQAIRRSLDLEAIFAAATNEVAHLLNSEQSSIVQFLQASIVQFLPERRCWRRVAIDRNDPIAIDVGLEIPDDNNPFADQLKQLQIVQVDDTDDIQDQVNREVAQAFSGKWLLVPLVVDEVLWGSLNLYTSQKTPGWQEEQIELARAVADQLAIAIHQANLFQQVQQLNQELEERVQRRNTQLQLAMSVVHMGTWEWDIQTNRQYWSPENYALWGFRTDAQLRVLDQQGNEISPYPTRDLILDRVHPDDREYFQQRHQEALAEGKILEIEHRLIWPDGSVHWRYGRGAQILDETGQAVKMIGVGIDITERKLAEAQVKASLKEKETLLQEIHHRVKNNLQIVTSLLRMQSQQTDDPQVVTLFKEAQNRVQSMALIHEQLYQAPDLAAIDFGNYLSHLVNNLFRSYGVSQNQVQLAIATGDVMLPINIAIPCGLMVNELVSNSLKYAFPDGRAGRVTIQLQAGTDTAAGDRPILTLTVADNGIGLPESLNLETLESLGLLIVNSLTHQLRGNLTVNRQAGTCFRITFPQP